jgi:topoisomerase-4 subunit A
MSKTINKVTDIAFKDALGERYLSYALSTIMSRSLPDVRDGLKPVHRRLLYAMRELKLNPKSGYKKSARIVGDVIGKYHPHGELAIYGTLVRLAQDFTLRFPLIDGQGNFGNIDGDNAAAMRYTEAKLTAVAEVMLEGLDQDAVDFKDTYDGEFSEPIVLPSRFPNLLANGAEGIAVGMATSIPPHNVHELCDALMHLISHPACSVADLVQFVQGPDFPTGGFIMENKETILDAYETGRGSFRIRARYEVEQKKNGLYQIVITEVPYQVQKARVIEKIADLLLNKKLPLLADVQDESTDDIRIVLTPKSRQVDPDVLMNTLFKTTELENRFNLNMNVVDKNNVPKVMNLKEVLAAFLDHRMVVLKRQTAFRLQEIAHRLELLAGYLIVYLNMDEVIAVIREEDKPKDVMMARWGLTDVQAEAILNMRLRSLRRLEEMEIRREHDALSLEKQTLEGLLEDEGLRWKAIKHDIKDIQTQFGEKTVLGKRRTLFQEPQAHVEVPLEAMIEREPITIIFSKKGWIRSIKGRMDEEEDLKFKDGDELQKIVHTHTTDYLLFFASNGKFYTILADKISKGRGSGDAIRLLIDLGDQDQVVTILNYDRKHSFSIMLASSDGRGFITKAEDVFSQTKAGKQVLTFKDKSHPVFCHKIEHEDHIGLIGHNRRLLLYPLTEIPTMNRGRGVILQKYTGSTLSHVTLFKAETGLAWQKGKSTHRFEAFQQWIGKRGSAGRFAPEGFPKNNRFF